LYFFFGSVLIGFVIATAVPRLLNSPQAHKVYRLYLPAGFIGGSFDQCKVCQATSSASSWIVYHLRSGATSERSSDRGEFGGQVSMRAHT
jgi:hypothetical protein